MSLHATRVFARRFGIDVQRWPESHVVHQRVQLMKEHNVSLVIDVGANIGELGLELREFGYAGRIVSFEPLPQVFEQLTVASAPDADWMCFPYALGSERKRVELNVAANRGQSSSVLPMSAAHLEAAPDSGYVGALDVEQHRLDEVAGEFVHAGDAIYLKADVQGYESQVLEGAGDLLKDVVGLQLEISFIPLYEGGLTWGEAFSWAERLNMGLFDVESVFIHPSTKEWLQADLVFFRR
jgi:FkbM family methyltransferase